MNGTNEYRYLGEIEDRDSLLSINEIKNLSLPMNAVPYAHDQYKQILQMTYTQFMQKTITELSTFSLLLAQYALYIQRAANEEKSRIIYISSLLDKQVAKNINQFRGGSWETQRQQAINDDQYAVKLQDDLVVAKQKAQRLDGLHFEISKFSEKIDSLVYSKRKELS